MKLLLEFASRHYGKVCTKLTLEDLTADMVRRFLAYLEQVRHNSVATRNVRLAAIHSFFQYLATIDPRHLAWSQSILGVQFKRRAHRIPEYLERSEIQSLFVQIDCRTLLGQRDDALLRMRERVIEDTHIFDDEYDGARRGICIGDCGVDILTNVKFLVFSFAHNWFIELAFICY